MFRVTALMNRVVPRWSFQVNRAGMLMFLRSATRLSVDGAATGESIQMCLFTGPPECRCEPLNQASGREKTVQPLSGAIELTRSRCRYLAITGNPARFCESEYFVFSKASK